MQAPPSNIGPHTIPQSNPGNVLEGMKLIQVALSALTEAMPKLPMGTPLHMKVQKIAMELTKELHEVRETVQQKMMSLAQMMAAQRQQQGNPALQAAAQPHQPPAMPPQGGMPGQ